ncbi:MAG: Hpt domain-containing protein [Myxacorys chilensis ATA2-1-KO14]|jgi:hypothetical protein|nr:Hpt domain-containing protein [Myxacorys chilensis ATA2-1-KO14]
MNLAIDWEHLHAISDGNAAFERELLEIFVEDTEQHLATAKVAVIAWQDAQATAQQNKAQLAQVAHHVKGSSANVGLHQMQKVALQLEQYIEDNKLTEITTLLTQLTNMLGEIQKYLKE